MLLYDLGGVFGSGGALKQHDTGCRRMQRKANKKEGQKIEEIQPWLMLATERLKAKFDPEKIILFGSWACGQATRHSDIDLFMVWQCDIGPLDRIGQVLDMLADAPRAVDAIVYTPEELGRCQHRPFVAQLLREGKVLYERGQATERI
ncbi:MAG: nucleotidyltransferase domain-containing protein [Cyanobacteria bacterium J06554_11]